jgi:hypothetical protein
VQVSGPKFREDDFLHSCKELQVSKLQTTGENLLGANVSDRSHVAHSHVVVARGYHLDCISDPRRKFHHDDS